MSQSWQLQNSIIYDSYTKANILFSSFRYSVSDYFNAETEDSYEAFLDHWVNCVGVFKLGVIEAGVSNGNTRLPHMYLGLGHGSVLSI